MSFETALAKALPKGISLSDLKKAAGKELWDWNPQWAAMSALASLRIFDIGDYLDRYPDIAISGADPIQHFVTYGINERRTFKPIYMLSNNEPATRKSVSRTKPATNYVEGERHFEPEKDDSISVIIPAYNVERCLDKSVGSVLGQSHKNLEIIIYDDGSTDMTARRARVLRRKYGIIKVMGSTKNEGAGKARNMALKQARGKYVTFMDADDYYNDDNFLQSLFGEMIKCEADIAISPYFRKKEGKLSKDKCASGLLKGSDAAQKFLNREFGTHGMAAKIIKKDLAQSVNFGTIGYSEDVQFVLGSLAGARLVLVSDICGYVYDNDNTSSWRPAEISPIHCYSSLMVLMQITIMAWRMGNLDLKVFNEIWLSEHGNRLADFLNKPQNIPIAQEILSLFAPFRFFYEKLSPDIRKLISAKSRKSTWQPPHEMQAAARELNIEYEKALAAIASPAKPVIAIWVEHLGRGGLERVAALFGKALSPFYQIVYLVENSNIVDYEIDGEIIDSDIFQWKTQEILSQATYIFDFHWKDPGKSHPFCGYALAKYHYKYVPTIHNTATCASYFEIIREYLQQNDKEPTSLPAIICVSEAVKNSFSGKYGTLPNLHILHNPIELEKMREAKPHHEDMPYILFCGRLDHTQHKGIDLLLQSYSAWERNGDFRLLLAGAKKLDKQMERFIESHNLQDKIKIIGFSDKIYSYMKGASFVVVSSRWEGFSMVICESLGCGTPVLSTDVGIAREVIQPRKNGYIVEPENIDELLKGMNYMGDHAQYMQPNCDDSIKGMDIHSYVDKIRKIIKI